MMRGSNRELERREQRIMLIIVMLLTAVNIVIAFITLVLRTTSITASGRRVTLMTQMNGLTMMWLYHFMVQFTPQFHVHYHQVFESLSAAFRRL
jgi:hypothetical protein